MSMHDRLRKARIEAGYENASNAARAFGWAVSTYVSNENGTREYGRKAAERYASAFKVSLEWLLTGKEDAAENRPEAAEVIDIWDSILDKEEREAWVQMGRAIASKKKKSGED